MMEYTQMRFADLVRSQTGRVVEELPREIAKPFIERIHYSRLYPNNIVYAYGLYKDGNLIGVCTYGVPASPSLCIGLAGEKNKNNVLELNRLALEPTWGGKNEASYLISHSLKMLPNRTFVVSYADTGWTHVGYVYQATNWLYTGLSAKRVDSYMPSGKHPRSHDRDAEINGGLHQTRNPKHRYVYLVGNKREKREMLSELRYKVIKEYPKGDEVHYDTNNPKIIVPIKIVR